jgi:hypothetical protein
MKDLKSLAVSAIIVMVAIALASGGAQAKSAEETQAILDYKLTMPLANQLLNAMGPMTAYVASLPDLRERMAKAATMTLAERIAQLEKDPKAMAILKQNNLTGRDYIVGVPTLRQAIWLASGRNSPNLVASPANLAFAKANLAQLKPSMDAADGMGAPRK